MWVQLPPFPLDSPNNNIWSCDGHRFDVMLSIMREHFVEGNVYHLISRGVDGRKLFLDDLDYLRFIHDLFEFNDVNPPQNLNHFFNTRSKSMAIARPYIHPERKSRKLLLELLAFVLMPNHYHLMVRAYSSDGITKFMKKLNMGYSHYFNVRYKRQGTLFQGRYKSVAVTSHSHFLHLPYYIHLNPLDLYMPEWRDRNLSNHKKAMDFLEGYRWSSFLDYTGKKNFPSVTQRDFLVSFFGDVNNYKTEMTRWLSDLDLSLIDDVLLE